MSLGDNIRTARIAKKMSQKELAEAISNEEEKFGNTTISNWENNLNKPDADTIASLCKVLNIDANYLLEIDNAVKELEKTYMYTKTISDDEEYSIEIKTALPFDKIPKEEQQEMIDNAMEELLKVKKEAKQKDNEK